MEIGFLLIIGFFYLLTSGVVANKASKIGKDGVEYFFLSILCSPILMAILLAVKEKQVIKIDKEPIRYKQFSLLLEIKNKLVKNKPVSYNEINTVLKSQQDDLIIPILKVLEKTYNYQEHNIKTFLLSFDKQFLSKLLYQELEKSKSLFLVEILESIKLIDFDKLITFFSSVDLELHDIVLRLVNIEKEYNESDIAKLNTLYNLIQQNVKIRVKEVEKEKHELTGKTFYKVWICECGTENSIDNSECKSCEKNKYGLKINHDLVIKELKNKILVLEYMYKK